MLLFYLLFLHILFLWVYGTLPSKQMWAPLHHFKNTNITCLQVSALRRRPQDKLKTSPSLSSSYQLFRQSQGSSMVLCNVLCQLGDTKPFQTTMRHKFWKCLFLLRASVSLICCLQDSSIKGDCSSVVSSSISTWYSKLRTFADICMPVLALVMMTGGREIYSPKGTRVQATWDRAGVLLHSVLWCVDNSPQASWEEVHWEKMTNQNKNLAQGITGVFQLHIYISDEFHIIQHVEEHKETQSLPQGIYDLGGQDLSSS